MARTSYSDGKRQREAEKARKRNEKAERRALKREMGPQEVEITAQEDLNLGLPSTEEAMRNLQARESGPRASRSVPCRLFVGGLSWDATEQSLTAAFEKYGPVSDAIIMKDRNTGQSRGFGFVTMVDRKEAARAVNELDGSELDGRNIVVNVATQR